MAVDLKHLHVAECSSNIMHHPPQGPRIHRKNSIRTFYRRATKSSIPATYFSPSLTFDHLVRGRLGKVPNQYRIPRWVGRLPLVRRGPGFDPGSSLDGGDQRAPCIAGARNSMAAGLPLLQILRLGTEDTDYLATCRTRYSHH